MLLQSNQQCTACDPTAAAKAPPTCDPSPAATSAPIQDQQQQQQLVRHLLLPCCRRQHLLLLLLVPRRCQQHCRLSQCQHHQPTACGAAALLLLGRLPSPVLSALLRPLPCSTACLHPPLHLYLYLHHSLPALPHCFPRPAWPLLLPRPLPSAALLPLLEGWCAWRLHRCWLRLLRLSR